MTACEAKVSRNFVRITNSPLNSPWNDANRGTVSPDTVLLHSPPAAPDWRGRLAASRELIFPVLWVFISFVSAFDTYLTVRFQEHLLYHEQNPIGRMLLRIAGWEPSLLIGAKFLGSTLVLGVITALYLRNRRLGFTVAASLAAFQLGLLGYLVLI